jgi:hypothetical protein
MTDTERLDFIEKVVRDDEYSGLKFYERDGQIAGRSTRESGPAEANIRDLIDTLVVLYVKGKLTQ